MKFRSTWITFWFQTNFREATPQPSFGACVWDFWEISCKVSSNAIVSLDAFYLDCFPTFPSLPYFSLFLLCIFFFSWVTLEFTPMILRRSCKFSTFSHTFWCILQWSAFWISLCIPAKLIIAKLKMFSAVYSFIDYEKF